MLRFSTAGESHGKALVTIVEGLPAGLPVSAEWVDRELARRMLGYGRGARMKIERDRIEWLSGLRAGETLGSPIAMLIQNRDWANWEDVMAYEASQDVGELRRRRVTRPRPGHADLAGVLKYDRIDARDILERASARETTARVAAGALAKRLLDEFGVEVGSHVLSMGGVRAAPADLPVPLNEASDRSEVRVLDPAAEAAIIRRIDAAKKAGDTLGGEVEVVARGVVVGLGSHVSWDRKLDGRLAGMLMSIPAVKGVEIGMGFEAARRPGSEVHDPIEGGDGGKRGSGEASARSSDPRGGFKRPTNNAGGLEGGMTTGEPVVVKVAMKPIATLMSPLATVDLDSGEPAKAVSERSDITAVPAMGVIAEALVALALADAMLEKFGGDSLREMRRNYEGYVAALGSRWAALRQATEG
ncbi:MAG: chorismate synthase [Gemmatimonadales bacterium]|jgi:chorismate synthase|nr:chorismate synthase [Gemmatimonadales bacterium]